MCSASIQSVCIQVCARCCKVRITCVAGGIQSGVQHGIDSHCALSCNSHDCHWSKLHTPELHGFESSTY